MGEFHTEEFTKIIDEIQKSYDDINLEPIVYKKSEEEIASERRFYSFAATLTKSIPLSVCPTYVILHDNRIDTRDLKDNIILSAIYKFSNLKPDFVFELITSLENRSFSYYMLTALLFMSISHGHIIFDFIGAMGLNKKLDNVRLINRYLQEVRLDFSDADIYDLIVVCLNLQLNERNRKKYSINK